jgi:ATP-dependent Lhr-like helicase
VRDTLRRLAESGRVVEGAFVPGGAGTEWCDRESLRLLRQRSLARLRHEVEPVDPPMLGRLLLSWQGLTADQPARSLIDVVAQLQDCPLPFSALEANILPARLPHYDPRELDLLVASGTVVWAGCGALGQHDGRVRLLLAETAHLLPGSQSTAPALSGPLHERVREHLGTRGASFFPQLLLAAGGLPGDLIRAIWELVWAGEVTNDTLGPLRAVVRAPHGSVQAAVRRSVQSMRGRTGLRFATSGRTIPEEVAGRWSLVSGLQDAPPSATQIAAARTEQMLERYGLVTREAAQADGVEGGFAAVYPVLRGLEEAGRIRRGYFVAGLGAAQFALPGALDRLRALRNTAPGMTATLLSACDPANPYGAILPWPDSPSGRRPARAAGATVILVDGALAAWIAPDERRMVTFLESAPDAGPAEVATAIAESLATLVTSVKRRALLIEEIDGARIAGPIMDEALRTAGFARHEDGYQRRL